MITDPNPRLLIVEDEAIVAADIEQALKNEGYLIVGIAKSGERAIDLIRTTSPDLALIDIKLHEKMSGIELAETIRRNFKIPFIFLTAYSDEITLEQAKLTQPYGYLLKPFGQKELHAAIETALYRAAAEKKLIESENRNRVILDTAFNAFVVMDQNGVIKDWNQEAQATFGWSAIEAKGALLRNLILPERFREAQHKGLEFFLETGEGPFLNKRLELTALHKCGREFPIEVTISPMKTAEGYIFISFIHDISARKLAEETQSKWAFLFENAKWGIAVRSKEGHVFELVNPEFAKMHGYTQEELVGSNIANVFAPECRPDLGNHVKIVNEKGQHTYESVHVKKDGTRFPVQTHASSVRDVSGQILYHLAIAQDLTERKRLEVQERKAEELARSNVELERFAGATSHDLQEPLRTVSNFAILLTMRLKDKLDKESTEYVEHVVGGVKRMQNLIHSLLDYSKIGGIKEPLEEVDVQNILEAVLGDLKASIETSTAKIDFENLPTVMGHPTQVAQIFQNLITNALKFQNQSTPLVRIEALREGAFWRFSVQDNGIGFEPSITAKLFEPFTRFHSRDQYPGSGIGLATCKKIVELHGGRIWAEAKPNEGATFYFTLPAANTFKKSALEGVRLLMVDDSASARSMVKQFLKGTGVQLETASDGLEALKKTSSSKYDLILMDIEMPALGGIEVASEMHRSGQKAPIIAYTSHHIDRVKKDAPEKLFADYMHKSLESDAFVNNLSRWCTHLRRAG